MCAARLLAVVTQCVIFNLASSGSTAVRPAMELSAGWTPVACWTCSLPMRVLHAGLSLTVLPAVLQCEGGHQVRARAGVFNLWPPGRRTVRVDTYGTPFGWLYDTGVNTRWLARASGRLSWGTDVSRMYRLMDEGTRIGPDEVVLDVPVGGGTTFAQGAPALEGMLVGIDLSPVMLERAARRRSRSGLDARVLLARGDATRLPLSDSSVDRILCFNGLHVIADKAAALSEFRRVLKPGGWVVGTMLVSDAGPLRRGLVSLERLASFFTPASSDELASLAGEAGFKRWSQDLEGALLYFRGE